MNNEIRKDNKNEHFSSLEKIKLETVIRIEGEVVARTSETINKELATGSIEVLVKNFNVLGSTKELPLPVFSDQEYSEEIRLKYRYLDLRRKKLHQNIIFIIFFICIIYIIYNLNIIYIIFINHSYFSLKK